MRDYICQKCNGLGTRRHHTACPMRAIGLRKSVSKLWRRALEDFHPLLVRLANEPFPNAGRVIGDRVRMQSFEQAIWGWSSPMRWLLQHRLGGTAGSAIERLDRSALLYHRDPVLPFVLPPLVLVPSERAPTDWPLLFLLPTYRVHVAPTWVWTRRIFEVHELPPSEAVLLHVGVALSPWAVKPIRHAYLMQRFKSLRDNVCAFLPQGVEATDDVAVQVEAVLPLFELARVVMPGMTDKALVEWAYQHLQWFRVQVDLAVRAASPRLRGWQREKEIYAVGTTLLRRTRAALDAAAQTAVEVP